MSSCSELLVPKWRGEPIAAAVGSAIVAIFMALAVWNLLRGIALISSALWLALIAFIVVANIRDTGWRAFRVGSLGAFAGHQILVVNTSGDRALLQLGYRLLGLNIVEKEISTEDIVAVRCNSGQASDLAGRDVDDWSVAIWFWHRNPEKEATQRQFGVRWPGQEPFLLGSPRPRSETEAHARVIVNFLNTCGIPVAVEQPSPEAA